MSYTKEAMPENPDEPVCKTCLDTGYIRTWRGKIQCPDCYPDNGPDEPADVSP